MAEVKVKDITVDIRNSQGSNKDTRSHREDHQILAMQLMDITKTL